MSLKQLQKIPLRTGNWWAVFVLFLVVGFILGSMAGKAMCFIQL